MIISPEHEKIQYCGRIDFSNPQSPVFVYAGSFLKIRFKSNFVKINITNYHSYFHNYVGYVLDDVQGKILLPEESYEQSYLIAEDLDEEEHELMLFKRMDACHYYSVQQIELSDDGELLQTEGLPEYKLEVIGDSVSCGEVSEAVDCAGKPDPEHQGEYSNSFYSYSWLTARKLDMQLHITSQGGLALMDKTGWFHGPDFIGLESVYDKIQYNPDLGPVKEYDLTSWIPAVIVLAFGQNDSHPEDYMKDDFTGQKAEVWREHYRLFIKQLLALYPNCQIICTTTVLNHDVGWDRAIEMVCGELNDPRVHHFLYTGNGCKTPGHIRIPEAEQMAEELSGYIRSIL